MRRLVEDLLREQVFDRGREVVDLETLTPAAIDVIKHPFEGPQPADQAGSRTLIQSTPANGLDHLLNRCRAALAAAFLDQLLGESLSRQVWHSRTLCDQSSLGVAPSPSSRGAGADREP